MSVLTPSQKNIVKFLGKRTANWKLFKSGHGRWYWHGLITAAIISSLLLDWYNPFLLSYAVLIGAVFFILVLWLQWSGWSRLFSWLAGGWVLLCYWTGTFLFWLFLENFWHRLAILVLTAFFTWWYLREWHRVRLTLFLGEAGAGLTPTLVLGFLSCFTFGSSAYSFLVFLNTPVWQLIIGFYLPIAVLIICLVYTSGWSLIKNWSYWFSGLIIMLQVFSLVIWWPTSFYVVGFTIAAAFGILALVFRQESQGFINRRFLSRELTLVLAALIIVLLTARWY